MNVLFSIYVKKYNNLNELCSDVVSESKKLAVQAVDKIKNGFTSLLNSISNSFAALKKMFSFSCTVENNKNKPEHDMHSVIFVDVKNKISMDTKPFKYTLSRNNDEARAKLFSELKFTLNERNLNNNTH